MKNIQEHIKLDWVNIFLSAGVQEGDVFVLANDQNRDLKIENGVIHTKFVGEDWQAEPNFNFKYLYKIIITEPKVFKPEIGEWYYFVDILSNDGYRTHKWSDDSIDNLLFKRTRLYQTRERVGIAVKNMGWSIKE